MVQKTGIKKSVQENMTQTCASFWYQTLECVSLTAFNLGSLANELALKFVTIKLRRFLQHVSRVLVTLLKAKVKIQD